MPDAPETVVIVNPRAADGRLGQKWSSLEPRLLRHLPGPSTVAFTERARHAEAIAREALRGGASLVVAVGGDGTFHEVTNGFFADDDAAAPVRPEARLGLVPFGTGGDLRRTLGIPKEFDAAAERLARGTPRAIDVGRVTFTDLAGRPARRHFINIADFGMGGVVVDRVNRTTKALGGRFSFLWAIATTLPRYRPTRVRWKAGGRDGTATFTNFVVANGRHFGGGLTPAPEASMDDGLFDVVILGPMPMGKALLNMGALRRGTHLAFPETTFVRAPAVETECLEPALLDLDGEHSGSNPTRFEVRPRALRVIA